MKDKYLRKSKGNFNKLMSVPDHIKPHLNWWINNISYSQKLVSHGQPKLVIYSDASKKGWGAIDKTNNRKTSGQWSSSEQQNHINILELKACQLALMSLCKDVSDYHIHIFMDNTTSCSYVNKFGGKRFELNSLARDIWQWCLKRKIRLTAGHVPGAKNDEADKLSRKFNEDTEWTLQQNIFEKLLKIFPDISVDLFASRINSKLPKYVTYLPDPLAYAIDAFTLHWTQELFYIFPPFSLIAKIIQKIEREKTEAVLICPIWTTQTWWASVQPLISGPCYLLPNPQISLYLPHKPERKHPLKKMRLVVLRLSGDPLKAKEYQQQQLTSSCNHGENQPKSNMHLKSKVGYLSVGKSMIPLIHL